MPSTGHHCPRTLHLVDIENLIGGAVHRDDCARAMEAYRQVAAWAQRDHAIVGAGPTTAEVAFFVVPAGIQRVLGRGLDGADRALLAAVDAAFVARRYDRVVIGSGDGRFANLATELRLRGAEVWVVAKSRLGISRRLASVAHVVRVLEHDEDAVPVAV